MKRNRLLPILLSLLMLLSVSSVFGSGSEETNNQAATGDTGPVTFSIALGFGPKAADTPMEAMLEEELNADFQLEFLPSPGRDRRAKTMLIMSDQSTRPDLIHWASQQGEWAKWVDAEILEDMLPYLLETENHNILRAFSKEMWFYQFTGENLYRYPGGTPVIGEMTTYIRKDWLDNLGLEIPRTMDEYIAVLEAFTHDDPDGNGVDDTYGFGFAGSQWRTLGVFFLPYKADIKYFIDDGSGPIQYGSVMPQVKTSLALMQDLYTNGVIEPDSFTIDESQFEEKLINSKFGSFYSWVSYVNEDNSAIKAFMEANPEAELIDIAPIQGPDGFAGDDPGPGLGGWNYVSMTTETNNPQAVMNVMDELASYDMYKLNYYGVEGEHYRIENGKAVPLISVEEQAELGLGILYRMIRYNGIKSLWYDLEGQQTLERLEETSTPVMNWRVTFKAADRPMWERYANDLLTTRDEYFFEIMNGTRSVNDFDEWVEIWNENGGQEIVEEANRLYDQQQEEWDAFSEMWESKVVPAIGD